LRRGRAQGARITTHIADVSLEDQVERFQREVAATRTRQDHLLFNNPASAAWW